MIGRKEDAVIVDLWFVEEPPAPSVCKGITIIKLDLYIRCVDSLLAGLEGGVQNFHARGDGVFDHDVVGVMRQHKRQPGDDGLISGKLKRGKRRALRLRRALLSAT